MISHRLEPNYHEYYACGCSVSRCNEVLSCKCEYALLTRQAKQPADLVPVNLAESDSISINIVLSPCAIRGFNAFEFIVRIVFETSSRRKEDHMISSSDGLYCDFIFQYEAIHFPMYDLTSSKSGRLPRITGFNSLE